MHVKLNGELKEYHDGISVNDLLGQLNYEAQAVAVARNGEVIPLSQRDSVQLCEGDEIEVLSPMQGG